jgi:hypothetical protein
LATTINLAQQKQGDANKILHLDLTAGAADVTVTYTIPLAQATIATPIGGITTWNVTTGAINVAASTYAPTTGVLTVACANNDRLRIAVILAT